MIAMPQLGPYVVNNIIENYHLIIKNVMLSFCLYREYGPRVIITMLGHSRRVTGQLLDVDSIKENTVVQDIKNILDSIIWLTEILLISNATFIRRKLLAKHCIYSAALQGTIRSNH